MSDTSSNTFGKLAIAGGVAIAAVCVCCSGFAVLGSVLPPSPTEAPALLITEDRPLDVLSPTFSTPESATVTSTPTERISSATPTQAITSSPTPTASVTATASLTPTQTRTHTPAPTSTVAPTSQPAGPVCDCSHDAYNCGSFPLPNGTSSDECFQYCLSQGAGDIHRLDGDNDGDACERGN